MGFNGDLMGFNGIYPLVMILRSMTVYMGMSENGVQTSNEIAIGCRDNDQQNHWVFRGTQHFQTNTIFQLLQLAFQTSKDQFPYQN